MAEHKLKLENIPNIPNGYFEDMGKGELDALKINHPSDYESLMELVKEHKKAVADGYSNVDTWRNAMAKKAVEERHKKEEPEPIPAFVEPNPAPEEPKKGGK